MSGTQPPARMLGASTRSRGWVRRHARTAIVLGGVVGTVGTMALLYQYGKPPAVVKPPPSAAMQPAEYVPPAASPPAIVQAAPKPTPAVVVQTPPAVVAQATAERTVPALVVTSFRRSNGPPEYMKSAKAPAAAGASTDPSVSGIAYKGEVLEGGSAFVLKNAALVLPAGSHFICVMDTGIVTGVPGQNPFACHLPEAVTSRSGVTLMEQGTNVWGSYQSLVGEGQTRIVAVTAQAQTPNNIVVTLGGPIADEIGAAGKEGTVENHWGPRIGMALILSALDVGASLGQSALQSGNGNQSINIGGGLQGGPFSQVTKSLLDKTMNIPPTITLKQGDRVMLWTTHYIDFSHVYALETVR